MMLYCISDRATQEIFELLARSCHERGVQSALIDPEEFDYANPPAVSHTDLLYRASLAPAARALEKFFLIKGPATFYRNAEVGMGKIEHVIGATLLHQKYHIPIPRTIYSLPRSKTLLQHAAEYLGGFPLVLKVIGGSHGVGVIKIESFPALYSVADYLHAQRAEAIMRQYITARTHARCIVIGGQVIDSIEYIAQGDDFRTNEGGAPQVQEKAFPKSLQDIAVKSVRVLGWEFGGVDLISDQDGHHYVLEVNMPCYFPRAQRLTGVDITGHMIDHLIAKVKK